MGFFDWMSASPGRPHVDAQQGDIINHGNDIANGKNANGNMSLTTAQDVATDPYGGTTYAGNVAHAGLQSNNPMNNWDDRAFMYGRSPGAADAAVKQAGDIGSSAYNTGSNLLTNDLYLAQQYRGRQAPVGDFSQQNAALGQSMDYGSNLAGLEATQGPSAAQAQLQTGTNQALSSQLALARSGRGFGGNAAAMGQAQGNVAGIQANMANQSAMLRAQEDAAWRQRQAANMSSAAGIAQGAGSQYGGQSQANLNAYLQNQQQNDAAALGYAGQGQNAYNQGVALNQSGMGLQNQIRGQEMQGGQARDDRMLRAWAAQNGYNLAQQQRSDQKTAAEIGAGAQTLGTLAMIAAA